MDTERIFYGNRKENQGTAHAQGPAAGRKKLQRHPEAVLLSAGQGKADRVKGARSYTQNARPLEQEGQAQSY